MKPVKDRDAARMERAEEQLRVQQAALDAAANGIVITDHRGAIQWANPAFTKLTGYTVEEARGQTPRILKSEDTKPEVYEGLWRAILAGEVWQGELVNRRKDGTRYFQEMTITPVRAMGKEITHFIAIQQDVTQRHLAEKSLQRYALEQSILYQITAAAASFLQPDELFEALLDVIMQLPDLKPHASWILLADDEQTGRVEVPAWRSVPGELALAGVNCTCSGCHIQRSLFLGEAAPTQPVPVPKCVGQMTHLFEDKSLKYYSPIPLKVGQRVLGLLLLAWQTQPEYTPTDHQFLLIIGRQVGLALRNVQLYQEARKLQHLTFINLIGAAVGSTLDAPTILQRVLNMTCKELDAQIGKIWLSEPDSQSLVLQTFTNPETPPAVLRLPAGRGIAGWVMQHRQTQRVEDVRHDPRWKEITLPDADPAVSLMSTPLVYQNQVKGVIEMINKRSGQFSPEDAELLEAVARTAAVAMENARLYAGLKEALQEQERAQARLVEAEKLSAVGRLSASIAHEINNPLQAVKGCLSLLDEEMNGAHRPEKVARYLGIVDSEIIRIAAIVQRMREFYLPSKDSYETVTIHDTLNSVLCLTHKQMEVNGITVETTNISELPVIQANPDKLKQVFLNLILNAADAMPNGGRIHISAEPSQIQLPGQPALPAVQIHFADTGKGIEPDVLPKIFEPFYTTKETGSGLGLYVSYQIIANHGGRLSAASTPESGTVFTILLPTNCPV